MATLFCEHLKRQVLALKDLPRVEIARRLGISIRTVQYILAGNHHSSGSILDAINDGIGDLFEPKLPECTTDTPVGSMARMEIYRERVERGEHLYHPGDRDYREYTEDGSGERLPMATHNGIREITVPRSRNRGAAA